MEPFKTLQVFIVILVEIILGSLAFFLIVFVAYLLKKGISYFDEPEGSIIFAIATGGEYVLLIADCAIGLLFVAKGVKNAWEATFGRKQKGEEG